jgi:hypothetical protein
MSPLGHHHEVVLVGDIREMNRDGSGAAIGVILMVDADEPCTVPIMFPSA